MGKKSKNKGNPNRGGGRIKNNLAAKNAGGKPANKGGGDRRRKRTRNSIIFILCFACVYVVYKFVKSQNGLH